MPTYDYVCSVCGHRLEIVHGIHSHGPTACPICGGPMRKAVVVPTVHFKGSGWAKKDRGVAASTKAAAKAGSGGDGASSESAGSSDGSAQKDGAAANGNSTSTSDTAGSDPGGGSSKPKASAGGDD